MARHIYVDGVDRIGDYEGATLQIESALSYAVDTCRFAVHGDRVPWGTEVIVEDDDHGRLFGGICMAPDLKGETPGREVQTWQIDCDDYTALLDQRLVTEVYENRKAHLIFLDLAAKYALGFGVSGVAADSPVIEYLPLLDKPLTEAFKMLCEYVGFQWFPDYHRQLHFYSLTDATPGPMQLREDNGVGDFDKLKYTVDIRGMKNRVIVRGGNMLSEFYTYTIKADGVARQWVLPHQPHETSVRVNDIPVSLAVENLDEEGSAAYLMNYQQGYIRASEQTPTLPSGAVISFMYRFEVPVIVQVDDLEAQAAVAQVMGGDGVLETTLTDTALVTVEAARAAGLALLRKIGNPRTYLEFDTYTMGWGPGQVVTVDLPSRGITGDFLVQGITITAPTKDNWQTHVEAGSTLRGLADLLAELHARTNKDREPDNTPSVAKGSNYVDVVLISDAMESVTAASAVAEVGTAIVGFSEIGA